LLGVGILSLALLGTKLYSGRDKRILTVINDTDPRSEELYGTKPTPAGLIEDLGAQSEEIARRIGEATPNYPRKEFVYEGGLWNWLKNYLYNAWLRHKDHVQHEKEANIQEKKGAGKIDIKSALHEPAILSKAYEKIDEKFGDIKEDAKEKIKEGIEAVIEVAKEKLDIGTETDESLLSEDKDTVPAGDLSKEDIKAKVNEALKPQDTLQEIKETLKEVADLGMGDTHNADLLDKSKMKVSKKFDEVKGGAKELIKEGISSVLGLKKEGKDKVVGVKEEVKEVKKQWEEAKKKLDEKFDVLKEQAKEMIVEEIEKVADETGTKKEIPQETIEAIEKTVDEVAQKRKGLIGEAREKVKEKVDTFQDRAKEAIKSGIKSVFSKAAEKIKSVFSSSKTDSEDHSKSTSDETQLMEPLPEIIPEIEPVAENPNFGIGAQSTNTRGAGVKDDLQAKPTKKPKTKRPEYSISDEYAVL